jgi:cell volume regulation protein A
LALFVLLTVLVRPLAVGACLIPIRLRVGERAFILSAGLKGAVPILLGEFLRAAHVPQADRLYGIIVVVVALSVLIQGSSVPALARALKVPMRTTALEPWTVGVRLRDEPEGVHRLTVSRGSAADGATVESLSERAGDVWVSIVVRASELVPVRADTELRVGDEVVVLAEPDLAEQLGGLFRG